MDPIYIFVLDLFRCVCPNLVDRKEKISKSYRNCRSSSSRSTCCGSANSNAKSSNTSPPNVPIPRNEIGNEQRYTGGRGSSELHTRTKCSYVSSRSRPLFIPQNEWQGYNNESDNGSQGYFTPTVEDVVQPKSKKERPTELLLSTKEFENGHTNTKSQVKTTYLEQFWVCAKRYERKLCFISPLSNGSITVSFCRRKDSSVGFGKIGEARKNLLHDSAISKH